MTARGSVHCEGPREHDPHLPPSGLPGLDPAWSRTVVLRDRTGRPHRWHVLDSHPDYDAQAPGAMPTLLCVHGNPTWSYLWRRMFAAAPAGWRVVAPDQLGMGYSQRSGEPRTLAQRVQDLGDLTSALGLGGPVVTVAHDWGGIISLGWALEHRDQLRGIVLANTAVHQPEDSRPPILIRLAHLRAFRATACVRTPVFLRSATALSRPPLAREVRAAFAAPYRGSRRRQAVGDFVADIPFGDTDPSRPALDAISAGIRTLDVPVLLLWGPRDPVFGEQYLRDLRRRLPQAQLHRYPSASHLLPEDAPRYADDIADWVTDLDRERSDRSPEEPAVAVPPPGRALSERAGTSPDQLAVAAGGASITWQELDQRVREAAHGLAAAGVRPGDRVALLVPPSIELTVAVYATWQAGATIVVADKGLGLRGMGRALRSASIDHLIGTPVGLLAAGFMRLPAARILTGPSSAVAGLVLRSLLRAGAVMSASAQTHSPLRASGGRGRGGVRDPRGRVVRSSRDPVPPHLPPFDAGSEAAVVFTSGATGPAKGVVYRHSQLRRQLDAIKATYHLCDSDRMVAAFAPFALYGPALGIASAVPDMDVTAPGTLTAAALADAVRAVDASVVFGSPAALRNVVATGSALDPAQREALAGVRLLMSAGAPVGLNLLASVRELLPGAAAHTPYGMTELLPVTDVSSVEIEAAGPGDGVCVGLPLPEVEVAISELDGVGRADGELTTKPAITGEICIRARHGKDRYDALWATERASSRTLGWHRSGDVGFLDETGQLWVQGRIQHLISTAAGVLTPVGLELQLESVPGIRAAAVVGVGPVGTQQVVVIVVPQARIPRWRTPVAELDLIDAVHAALAVPVAAVLTRRELPVDIRHASKLDRTALSNWAAGVLAGRL